jgi:hypothetical protein
MEYVDYNHMNNKQISHNKLFDTRHQPPVGLSRATLVVDGLTIYIKIQE